MNVQNLKRFDLSEDRSLRAWSAADELILQTFNELELKPTALSLFNDRFGYLNCLLNQFNPHVVLTHKSQEVAQFSNAKANKLNAPTWLDPIADWDIKTDMVLMKIPKSLDFFTLFLEQISKNSTDDVKVICGFMTRHFSPNLIKIAEEYFEVVEQSRAVKKARVLILSKKKTTTKKDLITTITYKDQEYKQYFGVFSADHIDYATQFFMGKMELTNSEERVLDLGSGNGIIAHQILKSNPKAEIHLMDDAYLAIKSSELNLKGENIHFHFNDEFSIFKENFFDLVVTNPPFHFEYEINIQIAIALFRGSAGALKEGGNLQVVANKHLNYLVHLKPLFHQVEVIGEDDKFIVYKCTK
ncbi:MAG: 23S rRNA (guanine1835-N2)-methyltransferase [Sphingobacteriales bacterium]|jgi:23S rRNA (guanine1835-N2)-methyltransferase